MKKRLLTILSLISILMLLSGCGVISKLSSINDVKTMNGWMFQYNEGTDDYSLFFGFQNSSGQWVSSDANVSIKIINNNDEVVYEGQKNITQSDFATYSSQITGERFLANVIIPAAEIKEGSSASGTVYFTVNGTNFGFNEANCDAYYCLPVAEINITICDLPIEIEQKGYDGKLQSKIVITEVTYKIDNNGISSRADFEIRGEKIDGKDDKISMDVLGYRLLDSEGYLIDSGQVLLDSSLKVGDKFREDSLKVYDLTPGESYFLELAEYKF